MSFRDVEFLEIMFISITLIKTWSYARLPTAAYSRLSIIR